MKLWMIVRVFVPMGLSIRGRVRGGGSGSGRRGGRILLLLIIERRRLMKGFSIIINHILSS